MWLFSLLACSDQKLGTFNGGPNAAILSHEDGDTVQEGATEGFRGSVDDPDDPTASLEVTWYAAGGVADDGSVDDVVFLAEGTHTLTLTVADDDGNVGDAAVGVTVGPPNRAPDCAVTGPLDVVLGGEEVVLTGEVSDPDQPAETVLIDWSSDQDGALGSSAPDSAGAVSLRVPALSGGLHVITLTATDELGADCTSTMLLTVDGPPTVVIDAPVDGDIVAEGDRVELIGAVSYDLDAPEVLVATWSSDADGPLWTGNPDASGGLAFPTTALSAGAHRLTLTATDSSGLSASASITLNVNGLFSAPVESLSPDPATSADDLRATITADAVDPEGGAITYTYAWYADGVLSSASTSASLPASATARGEVWEVVVTPSDGIDDGPPGSASLTIGNSPPSLTGVSITPTTPYTDDTLTAVVSASDPDGDGVSLGYAWYVDGALAGSGATLSGSTAFDKGQSVWVTVTPYDGADYGAAVSATPVTVRNSAPSAPGVTIDPPDPVEGPDDLWCEVTTASTDADGDVVAYTVTWDVDGAGFGGASTTTLAGDTVDAADTAAGERWTCTVTPSDGSTSGTPGSDVVTIGAGDVDYSDTWTMDTTVSYSCAFGLVSFNFSTLTVVDGYPSISVRGNGNVGTMTGSFTSTTDFEADNYLPGSCAETYTITGTFTDANTMEATLDATYAGSCFGCTSRSWSFTATR